MGLKTDEEKYDPNGQLLCLLEIPRVRKKAKELLFKPSWDGAPIWAKYLAMDDDGEWYWYEKEPFIERGGTRWQNRPGSNAKHASIKILTQWKKTLVKRPRKKKK